MSNSDQKYELIKNLYIFHHEAVAMHHDIYIREYLDIAEAIHQSFQEKWGNENGITIDAKALVDYFKSAPDLLKTCIEIRQMYEGKVESFEVKIIKEALDKVINKACNLIP